MLFQDWVNWRKYWSFAGTIKKKKGSDKVKSICLTPIGKKYSKNGIKQYKINRQGLLTMVGKTIVVLLSDW